MSANLYVHLPWCVSKCPYCDFNSYERDPVVAEDEYVRALLMDLDCDLDAWGAIELASVFIGGGTPSLFSGGAIAALLDGLSARCVFEDDIEITLEANPGTVDAARFRDFRAAGVNRLSIGVQSFDDGKLQALGRIHDGTEARCAIDAARDAGFGNLNLDLMFGLPGDRPGDGVVDLEQAMAFTPEHISWYQLTIEEGTAFARKPPPLPGHDQICDDYEHGVERLAQGGFVQYEISAYARSGREARHNLNYWRFGDYLGIGAGAHGKRTDATEIVRTVKIRHPRRYIKQARRGGALESEQAIAGATLATEFMLNALRLKQGFTLRGFEWSTRLPASVIAAPLEKAVDRGWLHQTDGRVEPTARGFRFLNDLQILFTDLEEEVDAHA
jgi:oxygen-independent coproporphyrinogen-3 oxidase